MPLYRQVNNLKIVSVHRRRWLVIAPDKRVLEEFRYVGDAYNFAVKTLDYVKRPRRYEAV